MICSKRLLLALTLASLLPPGLPLFAGTGSADTPDSNPSLPISSWPQGPYLTGDWGGLRTQLEDEGIKPYATYTSIISGNPSGGIRQTGPKYAQDINFGLTFDMGQLVDWKGATLNVNSVDRIGKTIRPEVGSIYDPVQIYGGQTLTLYNVTLEQKFWNDKAAFKIGRLSPGDDFAESPLYNFYINNGIDGQIRAVIDDTRFSTYPFATWGARLRFDPSPEFNLQTGIFEVSDQLFSPARRGLNFTVNGKDGILLVQQLGWTPEFGRQPVNPAGSGVGATFPSVRGLPGHYFIGGYWSNSNYPQFGTAVRARISYGFYAHADQMIYREAPGSDSGLVAFGTVACAPQPNISIIPFQLSGGALYQGLIPDRPKDMSIFGVIHGDLSGDYADAAISPLGGRPVSETDLEIGYRVQVTDFAYFQPDVQYIVSPGGTGNISNALILGLQIGLNF
jgi:porin